MYTPERIEQIAKRAREIDYELRPYGYMRPWSDIHEGSRQMYIEFTESTLLALDELRQAW